MINHDSFKSAVIALPNFAASAAIGTAAATVDIASSFVITQTVANIILTIPNPTNALAGDRLLVGNSSASTQALTINGISLRPGEFAPFLWSGTAWLFADGGRNHGASISVATIPAGNFVVTHNLAMPTGAFSSVVFRAYDSTGAEVLFKRNKAADTANAIGISSPSAITTNLPFVFDITPLA